MIRVRVEPWRASAALRQMGFAKRPLYLIWAVLLGGLLLFALFQVVFSPKTTAVLSAQLEEQQAIESDLSGNRQAAAASFLRCPTAQGFSDFSFSKRQELFRLAAARRLPEENDYFRALVLSHGLARWNKRSVAFYVSPELGESGKQLIERCLREWLDPVKDQVYFSLVGNENQAEIVCVPLLYSQQKGESVRGHTIYAEQPKEDTAPVVVARHRTVFLPVIGADGPEAEISPTYLHELGHALGISGHSIYADDLMFYDSRVNKLSNRDRNTMKRLYSNESASLAATLLSEGVRDHQVDALVTEADLCSLRDPQQAHSYYEDAAKQHSIVAYERLGVMFDHGIGVPRDKVKAFQNYKMAAEAGSPEAFYHLGIMYLVHVKTNPADWENARSCFERAADLDFGPAQCELGKMYEYGKAVEKDEAQAATLYELAANNEVPEAQRLLSRMYASGRGVTQDSGKAQYWAKRAQSNGLH